MAGYQLSVCAEMVFLDLPFIERVARIHALGFGVEIWSWTNKNIDALIATGARFTSMTGYLSGNLTDEHEIAQLLQSAESSLAIAARLNCPSLNLHGTGLGPQGLPIKPVEVVTGDMWLKAVDTLRRVAQLGEQAGHVFTLENLNLVVDHPGTPFARAADTLTLVEAVSSPALKMNLDLYHAQIGEGNLIELIRRCGAEIGEIQVADVPGRMQPGTGEINYYAIARTLEEMGYQGVVAFEGWASGDSNEALAQFRKHFTR
ncbi:hydroxypyruvate isomerase [Serratia fonticola]|uniref:Hydroxypyruvate isomerase n=1 Tax=Serratia fonticola TaxID=47917 RepID=A0A559T9L0_SERFO|nr:TIM barrel protein [Serratia fonticola]TQI81175.1 hydroxypyruvate isomerase [Serratia fonticola]TQI96801.1 hydroxypyruvate isomerase [Serratia fonticola]TVZ71297.1 hydroxypyruvate isomerase [Serratia fonticola]